MTAIIREAAKSDAEGIWRLIHDLAIFERSVQEHTVSVARLQSDLEQNYFKAFVAEKDGQLVGMALMYPIYSTWKGLSWYLEDIIVSESERRSGIGTLLFDRVLEFAATENAGRLGWQVLEWNEPAIQFYKKYNAELDPEWITCRIRGEELQKRLKS